MTMNRLRNRDIIDRACNKGKSCNISSNSPSAGVQYSQNRGSDMSDGRELYYCTIRNIPSSMKSKDLRVYFSDYVENGRFHCFHYRHRPENQLKTPVVDKPVSDKESSTSCCIISFTSAAKRSSFMRDYHGKHWMNKEGMEIPRRCFVDAVKVTNSEDGPSDCVSDADLRQMIELRPPSLMPHGNVGTPTQYFLEQIRLCRLPASLIPKLGLKSSRRRRKYDAVPFLYGEEQEFEGDEKQISPSDLLKRNATVNQFIYEQQSIRDQPSVSLDPTDRVLSNDFGPDNDAGSDNDDDQCEEWERHEALRDDVTEQDRTKPRKYEEEMEIVWEKGGPGLVWYTDKNYWDEREKGTDCDWAWADDWDVDYSVYYEGKSAGTKDAHDAVEIREDDAKRTGKLVESVFTKKNKLTAPKRMRRNSGSDAIDIEQYTKRIGSRILGRMGWKPGFGLGRLQQGRVNPVSVQLEEDGQSSLEKKGFGYHGERMQRTGFAKPPKLHAIGSRFDAVTDQTSSSYKRVADEPTGEILFRRADAATMKYR